MMANLLHMNAPALLISRWETIAMRPATVFARRHGSEKNAKPATQPNFSNKKRCVVAPASTAASKE
jgi:hypothetical protein